MDSRVCVCVCAHTQKWGYRHVQCLYSAFVFNGLFLRSISSKILLKYYFKITWISILFLTKKLYITIMKITAHILCRKRIQEPCKGLDYHT